MLVFQRTAVQRMATVVKGTGIAQPSGSGHGQRRGLHTELHLKQAIHLKRSVQALAITAADWRVDMGKMGGPAL